MKKIELVVPFNQRIKLFFGTCKILLILEDGNKLDIGRCSSGIISRLSVVHGVRSDKPLLHVGNFCEFADCDILIGGNHRTTKIFNNTLSAMPYSREKLLESGSTDFLATHNIVTKIGHASIFSKRSLINIGSTIGNACLVASAAVTVPKNPIPDFSIATGVPATPIKYRLTEEQREIANDLEWWNWDLDFLHENIKYLENCEVHHKKLRNSKILADDRFRLIIKMKGSGSDLKLSLIGIDFENKFISIDDANDSIKKYFSQIKSDENSTLIWLSNPFKLMT